MQFLTTLELLMAPPFELASLMISVIILIFM
jgi:hypothetical protein